MNTESTNNTAIQDLQNELQEWGKDYESVYKPADRRGRRAGDGRGRLGGRTKGTPNAPKPEQPPFEDWICGLLDKNRSYIESQLRAPWMKEATPLLAAIIIADAICGARQSSRKRQPSHSATSDEDRAESAQNQEMQ